MMDKPVILVTGATGYIGGRLVPRLLELDYNVRCLVRDPARLQGRPWLDQVDVYGGDVLFPETLRPALRGVQAAYYLVHSMSSGKDYHEHDIQSARRFAEAAREAGVQRIIYLGGLGDPDASLSEHLRSRQVTGDALRQAGVPVTEFRAAVIVGSGSMSFEMIRNLVERIPLLFCPPWVHTRTQPIGIRNILHYLVAALDTPESAGKIIEIGGADVLTYLDMLQIYAHERGLKRFTVQLPLSNSKIYAEMVHLVTGVPLSIALPLIEGLINEVIVRDDTARKLFPNIQLLNYRESVQAALVKLDAGQVETAWSDALVSTQGNGSPVVMTSQEGMVYERRQLVLEGSPDPIYSTFVRLGGDHGWLYANWIWQLRGWIDLLVGGVGLRRGRRDPEDVRVGDALDFWRVEAVEPGSLLRLRAEMKVPGLAWLEFQARQQENNHAVFIQTAYFAPKGLTGWIYWYALYPIHSIIFSGMARSIAANTKKED